MVLFRFRKTNIAGSRRLTGRQSGTSRTGKLPPPTGPLRSLPPPRAKLAAPAVEVAGAAVFVSKPLRPCHGLGCLAVFYVPRAVQMVADERLISDRFPRASRYHPDWVVAGMGSASNALWLTEWLCEALDLRPGMRVLDLGCGRAISSIFLRREFGVQVWATDLWFSASENLQRIRDAGVEDGVFPIHADARSLPFATE